MLCCKIELQTGEYATYKKLGCLNSMQLERRQSFNAKRVIFLYDFNNTVFPEKDSTFKSYLQS